jgi:hypothetical protein
MEAVVHRVKIETDFGLIYGFCDAAEFVAVVVLATA